MVVAILKLKTNFEITLQFANAEKEQTSFFQIFHYKTKIYHYKGQVIDFNLGMISSIVSSNNSKLSSPIYFNIFLDISAYIKADEFAQLRHANKRRKRRSTLSSINNTKAITTFFQVPTDTLCYVNITTETGLNKLHSKDGAILSWTTHASIKNITTAHGRVFVIYHSAMNNVKFRCTCMDRTRNCSG